ncbi:MAG: hypothetical protein ABI864_00775 [Chloroflexota bacterium]
MAALTKEGLAAFIRTELEHEELVIGMVNGALPANFDLANPCANAKPPIEHSHTFWPDGRFNSWDENGNQVDEGTYTQVDDRTFTMGDPLITFSFTVADVAIMFNVVQPNDCSVDPCRETFAWAMSVADPGQSWTRVTSGPHVP